MLEKLLGITVAYAEAAPAAGTNAAGAEMGAAGGAQLISMLVSMVLMVAVFYFLLIRPQRKKDKKVKEMLAALKSGDRICTIGGIYGTITGLREDTVTLSVGKDNLSMVVARWAIRSVEELTIENDAQELN